MRPSVQLAILLFAIPFLAAPAAAQDQLAPVITLAPGTSAVSLADNASQEVVWSATNTGPTNAQASVTMEVPAGWTATLLEPTAGTFPLNGVTPATPQPGTQVVRIVVSPGVGAANATLMLRVQGANQAGQSSMDEASLALTYIPPPPPPAPGTRWGLFLGLSAGGAALALLALYLAAATRPRIRLSALGLNEYAGTRASASVLIENRSSRVRKIDLRLRGLSTPWAGALMVPYVLLDAKSSTDIPVAISVPFQGQPGDQRIVHVQARPHGLYPWLVGRKFSVTILGKPVQQPPASMAPPGQHADDGAVAPTS